MDASPAEAAEPLKPRFAAELVPEERVTTAFLVKQKEVRQKKTGEPYLSLILSDRTGELDAKMWDNVQEVCESFDRDDFIKVRGTVVLFRDRPQLQIHKLRRLEETEITLADYLPATQNDIPAMFAELRAQVEAIGPDMLRRLLLSILDDPAIQPRFCRAPAAKTLHHAFFGGLLEHVLSLARAARRIAPNYPLVNPDILLAGIVLHDLGKIDELSYLRSFAYSTEGQLLGHITLALEILHRKIAQLPGFPRRLQVVLEHLILSHHGQYEFGSPKLPMFPAALLLHMLDDLDSKMEAMREQYQREEAVPGDWTSFNASLGRPILRLDRWLAAEEPVSPWVVPPPEDLTQRATRLQAALRGQK
ncbi:MAG: 3'-5' exoribonuclease YhaM family protein [Terriglobales bacterium]